MNYCHVRFVVENLNIGRLEQTEMVMLDVRIKPVEGDLFMARIIEKGLSNHGTPEYGI